MQPITQIQQVISLSSNPIVGWSMLPDELVLEIFRNLTTQERAKIATTCKQFNDLGSDYSMVRNESLTCQSVIAKFIEKNSVFPMVKTLKELSLDWINPRKAMQFLAQAYKFQGLPLGQLTGYIIDESQDESFMKALNNRYWREVRKQVADTQGILRFESNWKFTDEFFQVFLEVIGQNNHLDRLSILCDNVTPNQLKMFAEKLPRDQLKIKELVIQSEKVYRPEDLQILFNGLTQNTTIKSFQFYNLIDNSDLPMVAHLLEQNGTFEHIGLNGESFQLRGFDDIMNVLIRKNQIKILKLTNVQHDDVIQNVFDELHRTTIVELDIDFRQINQTTATSIADAIWRNKRIKRLELPKSRLTTKQAEMINEAMSGKRNPQF